MTDPQEPSVSWTRHVSDADEGAATTGPSDETVEQLAVTSEPPRDPPDHWASELFE